MNKKVTILTALLFLSILTSCLHLAKSNSNLAVSVNTNKSGYYLREPVTVYGNLTLEGNPAHEGMIGIQVTGPTKTFAFRTYTIGEISFPIYLNITSINLIEQGGGPKSFLLKNEDFGYFTVTVENSYTTTLNALVTISIFDKSNVVIETATAQTTIAPGLKGYMFSVPLPKWIPTGNVTVYANLYSDYPENGGFPYCPEKFVNFPMIYPGMEEQFGQPITQSQTKGTKGQYSISYRNTPAVITGIYRVTASAKSLAYESIGTATYEVLDMQYPPQASFTYYSTYYYTYYPGEIYTNMSITFDASASTAEGNYTDYITNYHWDFGDGNIVDTPDPIYIKTPGYKNSGEYLVSLNVTDSEGLWCITSKIIKILPPTGPKANFTWSPYNPGVGQTTKFDASNTKLGWNGTGQASIVSYMWDFGDGNITTVATPTINHVYTSAGNYSVMLTVTDTQGKLSNITYVIEVKTKIPGDIDGDGSVGLSDLVLLARAYGSTPRNPNWNPDADLDNDGIVGLSDLVILARYYGTSL